MYIVGTYFFLYYFHAFPFTQCPYYLAYLDSRNFTASRILHFCNFYCPKLLIRNLIFLPIFIIFSLVFRVRNPVSNKHRVSSPQKTLSVCISAQIRYDTCNSTLYALYFLWRYLILSFIVLRSAERSDATKYCVLVATAGSRLYFTKSEFFCLFLTGLTFSEPHHYGGSFDTQFYKIGGFLFISHRKPSLNHATMAGVSIHNFTK